MSILFCQYTAEVYIALPPLSIATIYQPLRLKLSNWIFLVIQATANFIHSSYVILFYVWLGKRSIRKTSIFSRDQLLDQSFVFFLLESIVGDLFDWLSGELSILCLDSQFLINCDLNKILGKVCLRIYLCCHRRLWPENVSILALAFFVERENITRKYNITNNHR